QCDAALVGFDHDRVEARPRFSALVGRVREFHRHLDRRQSEERSSFWCEVQKHDLLSSERVLDLLVGRRRLEISRVKVCWQEWERLVHPTLIVGPGEAKAWVEVAAHGTE